MSISNLSNDRSGFGPMSVRPAFLRNGETPTLLNAVIRYDGATPAAGGAGESGSWLFDGGSGGSVDYKSIAQALMARLDALRDRFEAREAGTNSSSSARSFERTGPGGWWHRGAWYSTNSSGNNGTSGSSDWPSIGPSGPGVSPPVPQVQTPVTISTISAPTPTVEAPAPTAPAALPPSAPPIAPAPTIAPPPAPPISLGGLTPSGPITLGDGAATIANMYITGDTGIVANNDKQVTTLNVSNTVIRTRNYGMYFGSCENLNLSNVDITCDPNGGDSYSIRGNVTNFTSVDSTFRAGIKAFRLYNLHGGSSTRDTYSGDRLMLGGGQANEWGTVAPFQNFTFRDGTISVNSVELYNSTSNVVFENMDFSGTDHISIQGGAHNITFRNCTNLPQIRLYGGGGGWTALPADPARNIVVI